MAIDRNADYTIVNASGVEVQVKGQTLIERALANEADTVEGQPLREYVRAQVDRNDTVAQAHEQGAALAPLLDADEEAERLFNIRELEAQAAVAIVSADPDQDNLPGSKDYLNDPVQRVPQQEEESAPSWPSEE